MKGTKNKPGYVEVKYRAPGFWPIAISLGNQNLFSYEHSDLEYLRFKNWLPHRPWLCYGYWSVDRRWDRVWYCLVQCLSDAIRLATGMRGPTVPKSNMYQPKASFGPSTIRWYSWFIQLSQSSVAQSSKLEQRSVPLDPSLVAPTFCTVGRWRWGNCAGRSENATARGASQGAAWWTADCRPRMTPSMRTVPPAVMSLAGSIRKNGTTARAWSPTWSSPVVWWGIFFCQGLRFSDVSQPLWGSPGVPLGSPWHQVGHVGPRARSPGEGSEEGHLAVQSNGRLLPGPRSALCEARGQRWEPPPVPNAAIDRADPWFVDSYVLLFPESVWAQGSSNSGGLYLIFSSSHLLIFTSSHLHICSSSHLLIFASSHLHVFSSSSHIHILTSSHLLIFASSHLHIFSSSHLHSSSSHLHICSSSHLLIFTSSHPHIFTSSHLHIFSSHIFSSCPLALLPSCPLLLFYFSLEGGSRGSANETARNATLSHETRFDRQKLR